MGVREIIKKEGRDRVGARFKNKKSFSKYLRLHVVFRKDGKGFSERKGVGWGLGKLRARSFHVRGPRMWRKWRRKKSRTAEFVWAIPDWSFPESWRGCLGDHLAFLE